MWGYYRSITDPSIKQLATKKLTSGCERFLKKVATSNQIKQVKQLKQTENKAEVIKIVNVIVNSLTGEEKLIADAVKNSCLSLLEHQATTNQQRHRRTIEIRLRRDQNEDKHFADTYLTWITPEQRAELKTLKDGGATVQALQVGM